MKKLVLLLLSFILLCGLCFTCLSNCTTTKYVKREIVAPEFSIPPKPQTDDPIILKQYALILLSIIDDYDKWAKELNK